jgi:hypothetical protein
MNKTFRVTRELTPAERGDAYPSLDPGSIVHEFRGQTYGCIDRRRGVAVSLSPDNVGPFFEMPWDALEEVAAESDAADDDAPTCRDCGTWPCSRHATDADRAEYEQATGSAESGSAAK